ncbi:MAG: EI24 domain-containing protein [Myxococcota bacterium]
MPYPAPDLARRGAVGRFLTGLTYPLQGFRLVLTHPQLWKYLVAPMFLSLLALLAALYGSVRLVGAFAETVEPANLGQELSFFILSGLAYIVAFALTMVVTYVVANLVAVPFNDRLSDKVEQLTLGPLDEPFHLGTLITDLLQSVIHSALSLFLWGFVMVGLLVFHLVPVFGNLMSVLGTTLATGFFLSREMMDGAMSRRRLGYFHKLRVLWANRALCLGFGMVASGFLWLPGLNILLMPMVVAGGTLMFCHLETRELVPNRDGSGPFVDQRRRG